MKRSVFAYLLSLLIFLGGIEAVLHAGKKLETARASTHSSLSMDQNPTPVKNHPAVADAFQVVRNNLREPLSLLLMQVILIILLARLLGSIFVHFGQPAVIGEMLAGILLGPSVTGMFLPNAFHFLFPMDSLGALRMLSQVGVILFMFLVGMELDVKHLRGNANTAIFVSHISILFPYFLGVLLSFFIFENFAPPQVSFLAFALFMGIALSITAFPVLARILEDRGMTKTFLGSTALTCAAVDDLSAWSILAFVIAIVKSSGAGQAILSIGPVVAFVAAMIFVIKPLISRQFQFAMPLNKSLVVGILIFIFSAALFTEVIGMHALFGAFLAGIVMPASPQFRNALKSRFEDFSSGLLLPLFFAFVGLRTQIGLLNGWADWSICLGLILIATLGKLGGSMLVARFSGMNWPDAFSLGALMNTRGLVELIVLNIGLDLGILSPVVFAMMVIMALVTTFLTGPLLSLGQRMRPKNPPRAATAASS